MKLFNKKPKYYVEVVRVWEGHSYDTKYNCLTYSHPVFLIKKRNLFKKDTIVRTMYYTSRIEDALDCVRNLNGTDFINNEDARYKYGTYQSWDGGENHDSGTYIKNK